MNKNLLWFFGLLIIILASCNKGGDSPIIISHDTAGHGGSVKYTEPKLIGKWRWLISKTTNSNTEYTPLTEGYTEIIEFLNDSVYNGYRNDTLILHTSYQILKGKSIYDHEIEKMILVKGGAFMVSYLFPGGDTLILRQECLDCYVEMFVKTSK